MHRGWDAAGAAAQVSAPSLGRRQGQWGDSDRHPQPFTGASCPVTRRSLRAGAAALASQSPPRTDLQPCVGSGEPAAGGTPTATLGGRKVGPAGAVSAPKFPFGMTHCIQNNKTSAHKQATNKTPPITVRCHWQAHVCILIIAHILLWFAGCYC